MQASALASVGAFSAIIVYSYTTCKTQKYENNNEIAQNMFDHAYNMCAKEKCTQKACWMAVVTLHKSQYE